MPRGRKTKNSMKVQVPGSRSSVENMKYEIANEFGVNLGATATSRDNGLVGGEITKRLVANGKGKKSTNGNKKNK